jgi:hypothetical protein
MLVAAPQPMFRARETLLSMLHGLRGVCERKGPAERVGRPFGENVQIPGPGINRVNRPALVREARIGLSPGARDGQR